MGEAEEAENLQKQENLADSPGEQVSFALRVLQFALEQVISEEDAECLADMLLKLTDSADAWADSALLAAERTALKAFICYEVMRSLREQVEPVGAAPPGLLSACTAMSRRSYANIVRALAEPGEVLAEDEAFQDLWRYSSGEFKTGLLRSLTVRLESFCQS